MNKIKLTLLALGVCFAISDVAAQDTKLSSTTEKVVNPKEVAAQKAKDTSAEIAEALKIDNPKKVLNISNVWNQYELSLGRTMASDKTAEEILKAKEYLEIARDKRLMNLFDDSEIKMYTLWKQSKEAEEKAVLKKKSSSGLKTNDTKAKAPQKK